MAGRCLAERGIRHKLDGIAPSVEENHDISARAGHKLLRGNVNAGGTRVTKPDMNVDAGGTYRGSAVGSNNL